jgi:hypothetical protein
MKDLANELTQLPFSNDSFFITSTIEAGRTLLTFSNFLIHGDQWLLDTILTGKT